MGLLHRRLRESLVIRLVTISGHFHLPLVLLGERGEVDSELQEERPASDALSVLVDRAAALFTAHRVFTPWAVRSMTTWIRYDIPQAARPSTRQAPSLVETTSAAGETTQSEKPTPIQNDRHGGQ